MIEIDPSVFEIGRIQDIPLLDGIQIRRGRLDKGLIETVYYKVRFSCNKRIHKEDYYHHATRFELLVDAHMKVFQLKIDQLVSVDDETGIGNFNTSIYYLGGPVSRSWTQYGLTDIYTKHGGICDESDKSKYTSLAKFIKKHD